MSDIDVHDKALTSFLLRLVVPERRAATYDCWPLLAETATSGSGTAGQLGLSTIGHGPGDGDRAHIVDESIALDALFGGARAHAAIVSSLRNRRYAVTRLPALLAPD